MKKVLIREHSREYSLFRVYCWNIFMSKYMIELFGQNMNEMMMVYRGEDLVDIYYPEDFLKRFSGLVAKFAQDKVKTRKAIDEFYEMFEKLKPYYLKTKTPLDIQEFKSFYDLYTKYYAYISFVWVIPNLEIIDLEIRQEAMKARQLTQEFNESPEEVIKNFLEKEYIKLKGLSRFVLPEEVWSGAVQKEGFLDVVKERQRGFIFYQGRLYTGEIKKILDELDIELSEEVDSENIKELKGQVAYKGNVSGKVRIVSSTRDLPKVLEGDILVASNTMPKYLPAMKKAAAFVTDEGGITCHAAIVSREMKKPCIVGTKIATRVLKDGDCVEVDAERGIVKILK